MAFLDRVRTQMPLDRFAHLVSYSPMLFHQVYVPDLQPASSCSDPVLQYTWQPASGGAPGRTEIAQAIQQAESVLESALRFSLTQRWQADEAVPLASKGGIGTAGASLPWVVAGGGWFGRADAWGGITARVDSKYIISGGQEAWTLIAAGAAVVYSDQDGDSYKELATVTVAVAANVAVGEVALYYPGTSHDPAWEIRPTTAVISGGVATITFARHLAVAVALQERLDAVGVDGTVDANFLTTVDVYRHYNDPSQMAIVEWYDPSMCDVPTAGTISAQTGVLEVLDARNGLVRVVAATWDAVGGQWNAAYPTWASKPARVRAWYKAGPSSAMGKELERAVTFLALSYLDREWLTCEQMRNLQAYWRADLAQQVATAGQSVSYKMSQTLLDNPFGTTRAAVYAWRVVQPLVVGQAVFGN